MLDGGSAAGMGSIRERTSPDTESIRESTTETNYRFEPPRGTSKVTGYDGVFTSSGALQRKMSIEVCLFK